MKVLILGMYCIAHGELSYEARQVHEIAQNVDAYYWTDHPLRYDKAIYDKPEKLHNFVFSKGDQALARTPRMLTGADVKQIEKNGPYDAIYGTAVTALDMGVWLKEYLNIPFICQVLDVPLWRIDPLGPSEIYRNSAMPLPLLPQQMFDQYRSEWQYWFNMMRYCDGITVISSATTKNNLWPFLGEGYKDKIHTIYYGIDVPLLDHYGLHAAGDKAFVETEKNMV